jgi:hypothetical protein
MVYKLIIRHGYFLAAIFLWSGSQAWAGTATNITGLYYTGTDSAGGLLPGGNTDGNWTVSYARVRGNSYTGNSTYAGAAYVLAPTFIDPGYVANSSNAQWITAPGASTAVTGGTIDAGGGYLPGNGTTGNNSARYEYRLAFTVVGTGTGTATNNISIALTLAADDQYSVYVNPGLNSNGSVNTGSSTLGGSGTTAWSNTTALYLQNFSDTNGATNASFVIGTNYIYVVVNNTNSVTGSSNSRTLNASGLLVYQLGGATTINGQVIPEVGVILPVLGALGLFIWRRFRGHRDLSA